MNNKAVNILATANSMMIFAVHNLPINKDNLCHFHFGGYMSGACRVHLSARVCNSSFAHWDIKDKSPTPFSLFSQVGSNLIASQSPSIRLICQLLACFILAECLFGLCDADLASQSIILSTWWVHRRRKPPLCHQSLLSISFQLHLFYHPHFCCWALLMKKPGEHLLFLHIT